jgi:fructose-bisphosphate aldolase class I
MTRPDFNELRLIASALAKSGKGILAADESPNTFGKRLASYPNATNDLETRTAFRHLLITTPNLNECISGIILHPETLIAKVPDSGVPFVDILNDIGIVVGVKVDQGLTDLVGGGYPGEQSTKGLVGLGERLSAYYIQGARFTKWRSVFRLNPTNNDPPSEHAISVNCKDLAAIAYLSQQHGMVCIVEPEIIMTESEHPHTLDQARKGSEVVLSSLFAEMNKAGVFLEGSLLKTNMVLRGGGLEQQQQHQQQQQEDDEEEHHHHHGIIPQDVLVPLSQKIAHHTLLALIRTVPPAVPGIALLSGGQSEHEACKSS